MRNLRMVVFALATSALAGCFLPGPAEGPGAGGSITVDNASSHVLVELRVAPVDQVDWGPNLLPDVLYPNESLTVVAACDDYDVLVTDDANRQCILGSVHLCASDSVWTIDNATLRSCGF